MKRCQKKREKFNTLIETTNTRVERILLKFAFYIYIYIYIYICECGE